MFSDHLVKKGILHLVWKLNTNEMIILL
jgi:hypothetical protein